MSRRNEMAVKGTDLETPERGMNLENRGSRPAGSDDAAAQLKALRERIAAARATIPRDPIPHCGVCFRRGWEAALGALEG
jgi:hypothetical protein